MKKTKKNVLKLLEDGSIKFKNGRVETPKNPVVSIENGVVTFLANFNKLRCTIDVADYCRRAVWNYRQTFDHGDRTKGVLAFNNGWEHKSLPADIMQTTKDMKVYYKDGNRLNCCRNNLVVAARDDI